jgi:Tol biopolymer transport system component
MRPLSRILLLAAAALAVCAAPASADSIVYLKDGNVWLSAPDGSQPRQLTTGGRWASPSQADDGTIVAADGDTIVRIDRSTGRRLSTLEVVGGDVTDTPESDKFIGPLDPKVSPDGTQVAYWFMHKENTYSVACNCYQWGIENYATTTAIDHLTSGPENSVRTGRHPAWINDGRVLLWDPYFTYQASTWVPGGNWVNEQWWFRYSEAMLNDGELSPDGSKVVAVAATGGISSPYDHVYYWTTNGPAWVGEPPYENDLEDSVKAPEPTARCQNVRDSEASSPTWSPDSRRIAYADKDGIWVQDVPASLDDCAGLTERLAIPGASEPDWGPAGLGGGVRLSGVRLSARAVHAGRPLTVRYRLSAPARVSVKLGARRVTAAGRAGANRVRVSTRGLRVGRYRLTVKAAGARSTLGLRIMR